MSPSDATPLARLEVPLAEFNTELKRAMKIIGRRNAGETVVSFAQGQVGIRIAGVEMRLPAEGSWPGEARVHSSLLRAFARVPPTQDPLVFQVNHGRLRIAGSSLPCHWQLPGDASVEAPLDMGIADLIRFAHQHSDAVLEKSGIAPAVESARKELTTRIDAAARHLAPLGVTPADLQVLVIGKLNLSVRKPKQPNMEDQ